MLTLTVLSMQSDFRLLIRNFHKRTASKQCEWIMYRALPESCLFRICILFGGRPQVSR